MTHQHLGLEALDRLKRNADDDDDGRAADREAAVVTQHVNFYGAEGTTGVTVDIINSAAYYTQALGHLGLGHRGKAKRLFAEVQRLKPDHLWANEFMKQFEK